MSTSPTGRSRYTRTSRRTAFSSPQRGRRRSPIATIWNAPFRTPKRATSGEVDRYWANKPYAFVVVFHSDREKEQKYYVVEPHLTPVESDLVDFFTEKLRTAITYTDDETVVAGDSATRADVIKRETLQLLARYDLYSSPGETNGGGSLSQLKRLLGRDTETDVDSGVDTGTESATKHRLEGIAARPEPTVLDANVLSAYQVEKPLYRLKRDFVGYERIDPIKHDINVEDISCDGYNSPVFV